MENYVALIRSEGNTYQVLSCSMMSCLSLNGHDYTGVAVADRVMSSVVDLQIYPWTSSETQTQPQNIQS